MRTALGLVAASLSAGCAAPFLRAEIRSGRAALRAALSAPAASPFGSDAPGIVHCHTNVSHDSTGTVDELAAAARATGARWVCLTDHTDPAVGERQPRGTVDGVLLVPGEEISVLGASMLALGTPRSVDKRGKGLGALSREIRSLGGVPVLGHVSHFNAAPRAVADGMAVYDLSDDFRGTAVRGMVATLRALASGDPEASAEVYLLHVQSRQEDHRALWDAFLAEGPCAGVAETNAHAKFRWFGRTFDPYVSLLGLVRNHVLVHGVDEASVLDAVGRGRLHVGFDAAADSTGARFEALRGEAAAAAMGESLPFGPALSLAVHLPAPARVQVLRDGEPWREGSGRVLHFPVEGPGVYRAEADLRLDGAWRPWVLFNPIRVLPREASP